jgi:hypothetical protein
VSARFISISGANHQGAFVASSITLPKSYFVRYANSAKKPSRQFGRGRAAVGLPAGACANAGMFIAGKLNVAKATLETKRLPIRLPIFMIPILRCEF